MHQNLEVNWLAAAGCAAGPARGSAGGSGLAGGSAKTGGKGGNSPADSTMQSRKDGLTLAESARNRRWAGFGWQADTSEPG